MKINDEEFENNDFLFGLIIYFLKMCKVQYEILFCYLVIFNKLQTLMSET